MMSEWDPNLLILGWPQSASVAYRVCFSSSTPELPVENMMCMWMAPLSAVVDTDCMLYQSDRKAKHSLLYLDTVASRHSWVWITICCVLFRETTSRNTCPKTNINHFIFQCCQSTLAKGSFYFCINNTVLILLCTCFLVLFVLISH